MHTIQADRNVPTSTRRSRLILTTIFTGLLALTALFGSPQTAKAWSNSSHVHLNGFASCNTSYPIPTSRVRVQAANGEAHEAPANTVTGYYVMDFNNVPSAGETAIAYVYCGLNASAPTYGRQFLLSRPAVGDWQLLNLQR
jgi:hypothetical protein